MRLGQWSAAFIGALALGGLFSPCTRAEEPAVPAATDAAAAAPATEVDKENEIMQAYWQKKQAAREKLTQDRKLSYEDFKKECLDLKAATEQALQPTNGTVVIDEETKTVNEPASIEAALGFEAGRAVRDPYEISPDDFNIYSHARWSVSEKDFRFDQPQYISLGKGNDAKSWFGFTFSITNTSAEKRRIAPFFTAVTNKGVFNQAVGGLRAEQLLANSLGRPLADSQNTIDKELLSEGVAPLETANHLANFAFDAEKKTEELSPLATFQSGQTRWGAALWTHFSDEFTEMKIVVQGLSNEHRYSEKLRRVLVLTFERNADEFKTHRTELKYKDKRWEYLWMWDQDITVAPPSDPKDPQIKSQVLPRPTGASKLAWAVPFVLKNSTPNTQTLSLARIGFVCPVEVDVAGAKVPLEVRVVDDGFSTIYKAQMLKTLNQELIRDRFAPKEVVEGSKSLDEKRALTLAPGKSVDPLWGVFDEADVDWADVQTQVEAALESKQDTKALAHQTWEKMVKTYAPDQTQLIEKDPGFLYDPRRPLTAEELAAVKEQVTRAIPGAVEKAKASKTVMAYFTGTCGLSSGTYRIKRCYKQLGVVDEEWVKAWQGVQP